MTPTPAPAPAPTDKVAPVVPTPVSAAPEKAVEAPKAAEKEVVKAAEPEKDEPAPANKLTPAETQAADDLSIGADPSGEVVDMEVFGQLLEIDDDDEHEFSKTLAFDYISQADTTFAEIDGALTARDLDTLSRKGHFLKGSSAALGLQRVQRSCELMQHFGNRRDDKGEGPELSEDQALAKCRALLARLRREQDEAKEWLVQFYKS